MIEQLIRANTGFIDQARELMARLDNETYRRSAHGLSPVGAHLRHIIEHYAAFVHGAATGAVDYDDRARDRTIETDRSAALTALDDLADGLARLPRDLPSLKVKMDEGAPGDAWTDSSAERELQFLVSHTVHHFALIKVVLRATSVRVDDDFGVAPSTLSFRSGPACAP